MIDRRRWLVGSLAALGAMPGCMLAARKIAGEPVLEVGTVTKYFEEPAHRVALAAWEAMERELAEVHVDGEHGMEFTPSSQLAKPYTLPTSEEPGELSPNFPGFWADLSATYSPSGKATGRELWTLVSCHFIGKDRQGRPVRVAILMIGEVTMVTAHFGTVGDPKASQALFDRVADRLAHPKHPPGSPEAAEDYRAFFPHPPAR